MRLFFCVVGIVVVALFTQAQDILVGENVGQKTNSIININEGQENFFNVKTKDQKGLISDPQVTYHPNQKHKNRKLINQSMHSHRKSHHDDQISSSPSLQSLPLSNITPNKISSFLETETETEKNIIPKFTADYFPIDPVVKAPKVNTPTKKLEEPTIVQDDLVDEEHIPPEKALERLQNRFMRLIHTREEPDKVVANDLQSTDSTSMGCECTTNGYSGETKVPYSGCAAHVNGQPAFCYVSVPDGCKEFSRPSKEFKGASWKFCSIPPSPSSSPSPQPSPDANTKVDHSEQDGHHSYTMTHSGSINKVITEGQKELPPDVGQKRTQQILNEVKPIQEVERNNITNAVNDQKEISNKAIKEAYSTIGSALNSVMVGVDNAIYDAMKTAQQKKDDERYRSKPSFHKMFNSIQHRVLARMHHLKLTPKKERNSDYYEPTTVDRLMNVSKGISKRVVQNLKTQSKKIDKELGQSNN